VTALVPDEFETRLRDYLFARAEETRAVRAGVKSKSELATIVARYADLFTREQHDALEEARQAELVADERERLYRLRLTCESGLIVAQIAPLHDALQNAELAMEVEHDGGTIPFRTGSARLSTLPGYDDRERLGKTVMDASAELNAHRRKIQQAREVLRAELSGEPDPVRRNDIEKDVSLRRLAAVLADTSGRVSEAFHELRDPWLDRLLGPGRPPVPSAYHALYVYRFSALADVYTKDRAASVCQATLRGLGLGLEDNPNIRVDLEDRPQKVPRAVLIPSDPPSVVHLITRAQGGLLDYRSFLHEAGHALHFAGCEPSLPYAFRKLSRDNALTEVYSYTVQAVIREPAWHARHMDLPADQARENAEAARFLDVLMFRRNAAKLQFELDFWSRFAQDGGTPEGYAERLTEATGFAHRPDRYLADMDADFYSADYLRAGIRSAQLRAHLREEVGDDWWCRAETGEILGDLFREGTRPSNEDLAERLGYHALDTEPLVADLTRKSAMRPA
jgi:hypothetical protein